MSEICLNSEPIEIFRGEALTLELDIFKPDLRVQKLTAITEITASFINEDGTVLTKTVGVGITIVDAEAGQIKVDLTAVDTAAFKVEIGQSFGVYIEFSNGDKRNVEFERSLTVKKRTGGV